VLTTLMTAVALFAPPKPSAEETEHLQRQEDICDPLQIAFMSASGLMLAAILPGVVASTIKMVTMGMFLDKASKGKTPLRFGKLAKVTAVLAAAICLVETSIKMIHAKNLNAEIEKSRAALATEIGRGNSAYVKVSPERAEAEALRAEMLAGADAETVQDFLVSMNQAIADVSAQAALVDVARSLLQTRQDVALVAYIVQLDAEVAECIQRRLSIEQALMAGHATHDIVRDLGVAPFELRAVERVLAVRADAAHGFDDAALVERHGVTDAIADLLIDIAEGALKNHWERFADTMLFDDLARDPDPGERFVRSGTGNESARGAMGGTIG
jgi:hypothetical protein